MRHHAVHPLEEVLDALLGLGREVLERERRPAIRRGLLDLLDHLHLEPQELRRCARSLMAKRGGRCAQVGEVGAGGFIREDRVIWPHQPPDVGWARSTVVATS